VLLPKKTSVVSRVATGILLGAAGAGLFGVVLGLGLALGFSARNPEDFWGWALHCAVEFGALGALLGGLLALVFGGLLQRQKVRSS
jgi:hypothetical protein